MNLNSITSRRAEKPEAPLKTFEVTIKESAETSFTIEALNAREAEQKALSMDYTLNIIQRAITICKKI